MPNGSSSSPGGACNPASCGGWGAAARKEVVLIMRGLEIESRRAQSKATLDDSIVGVAAVHRHAGLGGQVVRRSILRFRLGAGSYIALMRWPGMCAGSLCVWCAPVVAPMVRD